MKRLAWLIVLLLIGCDRTPTVVEQDAYTQALTRYHLERVEYDVLADRVRQAYRGHQELIRLCQESPGPKDAERLKESSDNLEVVRRDAERQWLRAFQAQQLRRKAWDGDELPPPLNEPPTAADARKAVESIR